jgi:hypothetical protein
MPALWQGVCLAIGLGLISIYFDQDLSHGKRELMITFHAFLVCMETQDVVVMVTAVKPLIPPT